MSGSRPDGGLVPAPQSGRKDHANGRTPPTRTATSRTPQPGAERHRDRVRRVPFVPVIPAQRAPRTRAPAPTPATAWALAARDGDPLAQAAFVRATQAEVWRFTAALVDPAAADDLTQETYLRAFRALPGFEAPVQRPHLAARHRPPGLRRPPARAGRAAAGSTPGWPPSRGRRGRARPAGAARRGRPAAPPAGDRRTAFALTQVLGLSYAEAAEVEGVPVGTIRSRVARARADLVAAVGAAQSARGTAQEVRPGTF